LDFGLIPTEAALQGHVIHSFRSGIWGSLDVTYFTGGRSSIDGANKNDLQQNWRVGATLAIPVDRRNSIKFAASSGVSARTGNNFDLFAVAGSTAGAAASEGSTSAASWRIVRRPGPDGDLP
jgi:hypothetical protein